MTKWIKYKIICKDYDSTFAYLIFVIIDEELSIFESAGKDFEESDNVQMVEPNSGELLHIDFIGWYVVLWNPMKS